ncbi:MAG: hypothetical protein GC152_12160 [Alphaproteobacteria bacterium]|nr:hypothetical protein [Alphaproteobacteria bacterium]
MDVVVQRDFEVADEAGRAQGLASLKIYRPSPAANGEWTCRYQFLGFGDGWNDEPHAACGADGWQALGRAMAIAAAALPGAPAYRARRLRLFGEALHDENMMRLVGAQGSNEARPS